MERKYNGRSWNVALTADASASQEDFDEAAARAAAHGAVLPHLHIKLRSRQLSLTATKVPSVSDLPARSSHASNILNCSRASAPVQ